MAKQIFADECRRQSRLVAQADQADTSLPRIMDEAIADVNGWTAGKKMNARAIHIFVIDFLLSGRTPGELLSERRVEEAQAVIEYIHTGPDETMAMTDPVLFIRLREAITRLLVAGW